MKFGEAHRQQRRIEQGHARDAYRVALGQIPSRQRVERKGARADERRLRELQHERRAEERDQGPEQRHDRRPVKAKVRALFGSVAKAAERVGHDLREGAGIGAVRPEVPPVRRRRAEHGHVDGIPEGDASQVVAGTVCCVWPRLLRQERKNRGDDQHRGHVREGGGKRTGHVLHLRRNERSHQPAEAPGRDDHAVVHAEILRAEVVGVE